MQEFFINKNSVNPTLRMELISDGHFDYKRNITYTHSIQNADVTFSMINTSNNILKISKAKANITISSDSGCQDKYILQYEWKKRDVNECGIFKGWFEIKFHGDLYEYNVNHPTGNLIIPIKDDLIINIK